MHKILFLSNTANFSKFNRPYMRWFKEQGWQVDYCSSGDEKVLDCDNQYSIPIARSPFCLKNLLALRELKKLLVEKQYDVLHCHTPMGGVLGRLAAKKLWKKRKIKVIYTAHGFHFYKGASLLNWMLYYPVEKYLSRFNDAIITMNEEDFKCARNSFHARRIYKINGVGVDLQKFYSIDVKQKILLRESMGFSKDDFILIYTAEFIQRKNHKLLFDILLDLKQAIPSMKIILCGKGELLSFYKQYTEKNKMEYVIFTGYTKDVADYCRLSDVLVMPSLQEGLPMGMVEAIATGLPVVASNIRGHRDIVINGLNGFLFTLRDKENCKKLIIDLYNNKSLRVAFSRANIERAKDYSIEKSLHIMSAIYNDVINSTAENSKKLWGGVQQYSVIQWDLEEVA